MERNMKIFFQRAAETARLMVGVGNYHKYCAHMQAQHPDAPLLTETEYFRYGQNSRYPTKEGVIKRCPC
jgi:uncharacterized short protein YbdD (DUF466 family)